ncbi:hypothetical protein EAE96_007748 [Botrytis aclada]|nr:hypothetical protein EAE96_007748 [Botrytis aclada]
MSTTSLNHSLELGEPIICLNTSCNYPFGRICTECSNELSSRAALQSQSQSRARAQIQHDTRNKAALPKTHTTLSRSPTAHSRTLDIPARVAKIVEDLQGIFAFTPASSSSSSSPTSTSAAAPLVPAPAVPHPPR